MNGQLGILISIFKSLLEIAHMPTQGNMAQMKQHFSFFSLELDQLCVNTECQAHRLAALISSWWHHRPFYQSPMSEKYNTQIQWFYGPLKPNNLRFTYLCTGTMSSNA